MEYHWEPLDHLLQHGLHELGARSWSEIGVDKDLLSYDPNWPKYQEMESNDMLRFMAVRDEGMLVGYAAVVIVPNLHDRKIHSAYISDIYLEPEHRKGLKAFRDFMNKLLDDFDLMKVDHAYIGERENDPRGGVGAVYKRLGFTSVERIWTIVLKNRKK
jgi:hypothetical protein